MQSIPEVLEKFQTLSAALGLEIERFVAPFAAVLPDERYRQTLYQFVPAILAARSPRPATAAAYAPDPPANTQALAKRFYSLLRTGSFSHPLWLAELYEDARQIVAQVRKRRRMIVAVDPLYLEKPYARKQEGVSKVLKNRPPNSLTAQGPRLTRGYPTLFGLVVNVPQPAVVYHHLFSYETEEFLSQPKEWMQAFETIRQVLRKRSVCIVADAEADDQKLWQDADEKGLEFIVRATKKRNIEVWNERVRRWEAEELQSLARAMAGRETFKAEFHRAGKIIPAEVTLDWFRFRLPDRPQTPYWAVVARTQILVNEAELKGEDWLPPRYLVLVTNRPVRGRRGAKQTYTDWCRRERIEPFYRFLQEEGIQIEDFLVRRLERIRRTVLLGVLGALFVLRLASLWPPVLVHWLRRLGSSTGGTAQDRGGPYLLLRGVRRILDTASLLAWMTRSPPPVEALSGPR